MLELFVDSLDEGRLFIRNIGAILVRELSTLPVERLSLRITCRTAEWSNDLESQLKKLWGDDNVRVYELAPLRRTDVIEAAQKSDLDSALFLSHLERSGAVPLAIKPITLDFLLRTYRRRGGFFTKQTELYAEGCRLLCEEVADHRRERRDVGALTPEQRMAVASRIAGVTVLWNRYAVWTGIDRGDVPDEDIRVREIAGGTECTSGTEFEVDERSLQDTLNTGLFSSRGQNRIGWAHQTYAEYLCARFLHRCVTPKQMLGVLLDSTGRVVPQLRGVAGWLASMSSSVFQQLMKSDHKVLLLSDLESATAEDREVLIGRLLDTTESEIADIESIGRELDRIGTKLNHPNLADQLRPFIKNKDRIPTARRLAMDLAQSTQSETLGDDLASVALDSAEQHSIRVCAAFALSLFKNIAARGRLRPLALGLAGDDPDDELKGLGLFCAWPEALTATELFGALRTPKRPNLIGMYHRFLQIGVEENSIDPVDLPIALQWILDEVVGETDRSPLAELADSIVAQALNYLHIPAVLSRLAAVTAAMLRSENAVPRIADGIFAKALMTAERTVRLRLIQSMLPFLDPFGAWILTRDPSLLGSDDTEWLLDRLRDASTNTMRRIVASLISHLIDPQNVEQVDAVLREARINDVLRTELPWIEPTMLNSTEAASCRSAHSAARARTSVERRLLVPPPEERIARSLDRFEAGDTCAFIQLVCDMTLDPTGEDNGDKFNPDLTQLPGWRLSDDVRRGRVIKAARRYLDLAKPEINKWLSKDQFTYLELAGYQALVLLSLESSGTFSELPQQVWTTWAPVSVTYPPDGGRYSIDPSIGVIRSAYHRAPDAILDAIDIVISKAEGESRVNSIVRRLESIWDQRLASKLLHRARDPGLAPGPFKALLASLFRHRVPGAYEIAVDALTCSLEGDESGRARGRDAAVTLMQEADNAGWDVVWPILKAEQDLGLEILSHYVHGTQAHAKSLASRLTEAQIGDLYGWLAERVPYRSMDAASGSKVNRCFELDLWRSHLLEELRRRGTFEACQAIRDLIKRVPMLSWLSYYLAGAEESARQNSWSPLHPSELFRLTRDKNLRFVQTGEQLLNALIESLERLEADLQGVTPAAIDLWDEIGKKRPKDEQRLSDYIKRHLERDVAQFGLVVNREVEIRRGTGGAPGERTDIHVDAVNPHGEYPERLSVIIEVKGCWNAEVLNAMKHQLVDRYLADNKSPFGLYVVGWYVCDQWDSEDQRRRRTPNKTLAEFRQQMEAQARELSEQGRMVRAYTLNVALR